jgi:DNA polymerase III delta prime subunit
MLQNLRYFTNKTITEGDIYEISTAIPHSVIKQIWNINTFTDINKMAAYIKSNCLNVHDIFVKLSLEIIQSVLPERTKAHLCFEIGQAEQKLLDGANEHIQMLYVLTQLVSSKLNV